MPDVYDQSCGCFLDFSDAVDAALDARVPDLVHLLLC